MKLKILCKGWKYTEKYKLYLETAHPTELGIAAGQLENLGVSIEILDCVEINLDKEHIMASCLE
tara:strand:+ start:4374 stop:4565 length:192 start_codon:yes stop_codon:yes gene_type:complete